MQNKTVDFIIIGQGLAGTVLSKKLLDLGFSVHVFDLFKPNCATRIAAGVFNPVTYRKLKMAEFADFLIPKVFDFYPKISKQLNQDFFQSTSFLKILTDIEEVNNWQIQCANQKNSAFMSKSTFTDDFENTIKIPNGAGQVLQSGVVKLSAMLDYWKEYLISENSITNEVFDYDSVLISENLIQYKNLRAKNIVFCEGIGIVNNPWFNWLPMQQFKGEVLEISAPELKLTRMVNRGVFLLPLENGNYKVGATHDWKNVDENTTDDGKKELIDKLNNIINVPYKVVKHEAGLRPATRDRHPYIGVHPKHKNVFVMNGLGSKGVIMAPWLADTFITGIENLEWPKGFDITRYLRFYNEQQQHEKN